MVVLTSMGLKTALSGKKSSSRRTPAVSVPQRGASSPIRDRSTPSNTEFIVVVVNIVIVGDVESILY